MAELLTQGKLFSTPMSDYRGSSPFYATHNFRSSSSSSPSSSSSSSTSSSSSYYLRRNGFFGTRLAVNIQNQKLPYLNLHAAPPPVKMQLAISKAMKWWVKGVQPNMKEVSSAHDLVHSLAASGNKLVIVDFFSPGCGGCRSLHPKICQFAEKNPNVLFLQVNYEDHRSMCYSLNVHVLPFFRFYKGAQGRLCSFSCTNATIKKFKDALAKHSTERCSLGEAKGLEESELVALAANKDLHFCYSKKEVPSFTVPSLIPELSLSLESEDKTLLAAAAGR